MIRRKKRYCFIIFIMILKFVVEIKKVRNHNRLPSQDSNFCLKDIIRFVAIRNATEIKANKGAKRFCPIVKKEDIIFCPGNFI